MYAHSSIVSHSQKQQYSSTKETAKKWLLMTFWYIHRPMPFSTIIRKAFFCRWKQIQRTEVRQCAGNERLHDISMKSRLSGLREPSEGGLQNVKVPTHIWILRNWGPMHHSYMSAWDGVLDLKWKMPPNLSQILSPSDNHLKMKI